jgi:hypothetical protein
MEAAELGALLGEDGLGLTVDPDELRAVVAEISNRGDEGGAVGSVSFEKLLRWFEVFDVKATFNKYDKDGNGSIGTVLFVSMKSYLL